MGKSVYFVNASQLPSYSVILRETVYITTAKQLVFWWPHFATARGAAVLAILEHRRVPIFSLHLPAHHWASIFWYGG